MYEDTIASSEVEQVSLDLPGVTMQVLHTEGSGGMTVLTHLAPGATIPEHWHTNADETVYVLSGDFVEASVPHGPGTFFAGRAGTRHGPHSTVHGCTVLTRFSATLDFQLAGQP